MPHANHQNANYFDETSQADAVDYSCVTSVARIACYDDLRSAPRILEVQPADTTTFIENLSSAVYNQSQSVGGSIPYTIIREVSENFIHARFQEIVVSILDKGNTIRFADQGPGITQKEKAQLPGFSSATEPMKRYIRGVGSGLPIVREYLDISHGSISIEDNLNSGSVVTISMIAPDEISKTNCSPHDQSPTSHTSETAYLNDQNKTHRLPSHVDPSKPPFRPFPQAASARQNYEAYQAQRIQMALNPLSQRERDLLPILLSEGEIGVTELSRIANLATSSTYVVLKKLEESGLVEKSAGSGKKRSLTPLGKDVATALI